MCYGFFEQASCLRLLFFWMLGSAGSSQLSVGGYDG